MREKLRQDLVALGVEPGMGLIVHSSLSSVGWVLGGAPTVIWALLDALGDEGTLVMPAATPECLDPAAWPNPVPEAWLEEVRKQQPLFDRDTTPTSMGAIAETLRTWPRSLRSDHPVESVCALGPLALEITREHPLAYSEGPDGPFGRLYELDFRTLLLGVGFNRCTALHFAETLVGKRRTTVVRFPYREEGRRVWREVPNVANDNDTHFPVIGNRYISSGHVQAGLIGAAQSALFPIRDLVDYAVAYFKATL